MMKTILLLITIIVFLFSFKKKEVTWTAIGDSITYLNDHLDETWNQVHKGYMSRVTDKLSNIKYINQGHNGWTSFQIAERIDQLKLQRSDVYSIFLGTNDWWVGHPAGTIEDYINHTGTATTTGSFRIIIDHIRSLNLNAKIVLITPMQRADFVYKADMRNNAFGSYQSKNGQSLESFANAVVQIGKHEHIGVIDLYHATGMEIQNMVHFKRLKDPATNAYRDYPYPAYEHIPFHPDTDQYPYPPVAENVTFDGLHPSDKGNQMIAEKIIKVFKKYKW